eukprot:CAMPEP_0197285088 /NCGR_PEP_ID=MMETSP0890-20130614/229_1 /TAXON_ID=44058 ORGANISM="Aureoumbra lagunensis, Strain CCMP1510" /NCGR_SAMPLE_ID=MMETSP0890 /ASSEMBLY_ACC=CAM_ASM_000533 /LENGTH=221 /DNA_ID=CAMNT_0042752263 /DNA_START=81 /DNA_END=746 /DNA_ORIENTATION=+
MQKIAVCIGYGPGIGAATARKFSKEGFQVALISRNADKLKAATKEIPNSHAFPADVTDPTSLTSALQSVQSALGPIDCMVYNAGSGLWKSYDELEIDELDYSMKCNCYGLLTAAKAVCPSMQARGSGSVIITGATAALRGKPKTAAFAAAKAAQRSMAQSLARQLFPNNIHVSYVIIDGAVGLSETRIDPDAIADTYFTLYQQPKSCWTFELDVRPYVETW